MAIREYEQKLADGNDEMEVLRARLDENRETEDALRKTLLAAQRTADQIIEEARRDSERILSDARADALRMTMGTRNREEPAGRRAVSPARDRQ